MTFTQYDRMKKINEVNMKKITKFKLALHDYLHNPEDIIVKNYLTKLISTYTEEEKTKLYLRIKQNLEHLNTTNETLTFLTDQLQNNDKLNTEIDVLGELNIEL